MEKAKIYSGYEYKEVKGNYEKLSFYLDSYQCFGWEINDSIPAKDNHLYLKRSRNIVNRMELTRLQRHFEADLEKIHILEESKKSLAKIVCMILSSLGITMIAGSVFAITAINPDYILCGILGLPGIFLCILAVFVRKPLIHYKTQKISPLLESRYEEIYGILDKGRNLLEK